jgi:hypothetical protein
MRGSFTWRNVGTWERLFNFPSEGKHAEDFYIQRNPTSSAGFEPANSGARGQRLSTTRFEHGICKSVFYFCNTFRINNVYARCMYSGTVSTHDKPYSRGFMNKTSTSKAFSLKSTWERYEYKKKYFYLYGRTLYFSVCDLLGKNWNIVGNTVSLDLGRVLRIACVRHLMEWLGTAERLHMYNWPQAMYCLISSTTLTLVQTSRVAEALLEGTCVLWSHSPVTQLKLFTLFHISVKECVYFKTGRNSRLLVEWDASVLGPVTTNSFSV